MPLSCIRMLGVVSGEFVRPVRHILRFRPALFLRLRLHFAEPSVHFYVAPLRRSARPPSPFLLALSSKKRNIHSVLSYRTHGVGKPWGRPASS